MGEGNHPIPSMRKTFIWNFYGSSIHLTIASPLNQIKRWNEHEKQQDLPEVDAYKKSH